MIFLIIIIILLFAWPYIWRWLQPYFYRWVRRCAENYFRRSMGMPPHDNSRQRTDQRSSYHSNPNRTGTGQRRRSAYDDPIIPRDYAEDVEFTEIHTYSEDPTIDDYGEVRYKRESQVSEAEIIEIKKDK